MNERDFKAAGHVVVDQYGNRFEITDELARGGQGVVYRTADSDLAIKQPLAPNGRPDRNSDLQETFEHIRCLPLPQGLSLSLPVSILKSEPGYVMPLLNGMKSFAAFELNGEERKAMGEEPLPFWLKDMPSQNDAVTLAYYAKTGSSKRRLYALYKCAALLARLHAAGLVYGDVSPNNAFIGEGEPCEVWLIDADNLRFERSVGGQSVYTPHYGAPEIVRGLDSSRPYSDVWALSVMAFEMLALTHPFIGRAVLDPEGGEGDWACDDWDDASLAGSKPADLDEQAYQGFLPFVDDAQDRSNEGMSGLPRELVLTPLLRQLFQETLGVGREKYWRRSSPMLWSYAFAQAHDSMLVCPACHMSYFHEEKCCPFCKRPHPAYALAKTLRWSMVIEAKNGAYQMDLPHRLFNPFSLEHGDDAAYSALVDVVGKRIEPVRGTEKFPDSLTFCFVEEGRR